MTDAAILETSLITGVSFLIFFIILLEILRPLFPRQYKYRERLRNYYPEFKDMNGRQIWIPSQLPTKRPLSWIPATFAVKESDIAKHISLDAVVFLRFLRSTMYLYLALSILTCVTLLPAYATGPNKALDASDPKYVSGVLILTMSNVERGGPQLVATFLVEIGVMITVYGFYYSDYKRYTFYARKSLAMRKASNFAVLIADIPLRINNDEIVYRIMDRLFHKQIAAIYLYNHRKSLDRMKFLWVRSLERKERRELEFHRKMVKFNKKNANGNEKKSPKRSEIDVDKKWCVSSNEKVDEILWWTQRQVFLWNQVKRLQFKCDRNLQQLLFQSELKQSYADEMKRLSKAESTISLDKPNGIDAAPNSAANVDRESGTNSGTKDEEVGNVVARSLREESKFLGFGDKNMDEFENEIVKGDMSRCAVAVFKTRHAAALACQTQIWDKADRFTIIHAPDASAIRWWKLGVAHRYKNVGSVLTFMACFTIILLWSPISLGISALSNLTTLAQVEWLSWLEPILSWPQWILDLIQGMVPMLLLNLFSVLISLLFRLIITRGRHYSQGEVEDRLRNYYFLFLVFGHFLYVLVSGSILSQLDVILSDFASFVNILATSIPAQSIYFMNYVLYGAFITFPQLLSQWIRIFQRLWIYYGLGVNPQTERELRRVDAGMSSFFLYFKFYALPLTVNLVSIVYSSVAPLINIFALVYFGIAYFTCKHNICFTNYNVFDYGGRYYHGVFSSLVVSLIIKQVFMVILFSVFARPVLSALEALFFISSVVCTIYISKKFFRLSRSGSIVSIFDAYGEVINEDDEVTAEFIQAYVPPSLKPLPKPYDLSGIPREDAKISGLDLDIGNDVDSPDYPHRKYV